MATVNREKVNLTVRQGFTLEAPIQFPDSLASRDFEVIVRTPSGDTTYALASPQLYVSGAASAGLLVFKLADTQTDNFPVSRDGEVSYELAETTGADRKLVMAGSITVTQGFLGV
jgi:hypothetical protein